MTDSVFLGPSDENYVPGLPTGEVLPALREARSAAVEAMLAAEEADKTARTARRKARQRLKTYERLLEEHAGQLALLPEN